MGETTVVQITLLVLTETTYLNMMYSQGPELTFSILSYYLPEWKNLPAKQLF